MSDSNPSTAFGRETRNTLGRNRPQGKNNEQTLGVNSRRTSNLPVDMSMPSISKGSAVDATDWINSNIQVTERTRLQQRAAAKSKYTESFHIQDTAGRVKDLMELHARYSLRASGRQSNLDSQSLIQISALPSSEMVNVTTIGNKSKPQVERRGKAKLNMAKPEVIKVKTRFAVTGSSIPRTQANASKAKKQSCLETKKDSSTQQNFVEIEQDIRRSNTSDDSRGQATPSTPKQADRGSSQPGVPTADAASMLEEHTANKDILNHSANIREIFEEQNKDLQLLEAAREDSLRSLDSAAFREQEKYGPTINLRSLSQLQVINSKTLLLKLDEKPEKTDRTHRAASQLDQHAQDQRLVNHMSNVNRLKDVHDLSELVRFQIKTVENEREESESSKALKEQLTANAQLLLKIKNLYDPALAQQETSTTFKKTDRKRRAQHSPHWRAPLDHAKSMQMLVDGLHADFNDSDALVQQFHRINQQQLAERQKSTLDVRNYHQVRVQPSKQYLQNVKSVSAAALDKPGVLIHRRASFAPPPQPKATSKLDVPPEGFKQFKLPEIDKRKRANLGSKSPRTIQRTINAKAGSLDSKRRPVRNISKMSEQYLTGSNRSGSKSPSTIKVNFKTHELDLKKYSDASLKSPSPIQEPVSPGADTGLAIRPRKKIVHRGQVNISKGRKSIGRAEAAQTLAEFDQSYLADEQTVKDTKGSSQLENHPTVMSHKQHMKSTRTDNHTMEPKEMKIFDGFHQQSESEGSKSSKERSKTITEPDDQGQNMRIQETNERSLVTEISRNNLANIQSSTRLKPKEDDYEYAFLEPKLFPTTGLGRQLQESKTRSQKVLQQAKVSTMKLQSKKSTDMKQAQAEPPLGKNALQAMPDGSASRSSVRRDQSASILSNYGKAGQIFSSSDDLLTSNADGVLNLKASKITVIGSKVNKLPIKEKTVVPQVHNTGRGSTERPADKRIEGKDAPMKVEPATARNDEDQLEKIGSGEQIQEDNGLESIRNSDAATNAMNEDLIDTLNDFNSTDNQAAKVEDPQTLKAYWVPGRFKRFPRFSVPDQRRQYQIDNTIKISKKAQLIDPRQYASESKLLVQKKMKSPKIVKHGSPQPNSKTKKHEQPHEDQIKEHSEEQTHLNEAQEQLDSPKLAAASTQRNLDAIRDSQRKDTSTSRPTQRMPEDDNTTDREINFVTDETKSNAGSNTFYYNQETVQRPDLSEVRRISGTFKVKAKEANQLYLALAQQDGKEFAKEAVSESLRAFKRGFLPGQVRKGANSKRLKPINGDKQVISLIYQHEDPFTQQVNATGINTHIITPLDELKRAADNRSSSLQAARDAKKVVSIKRSSVSKRKLVPLNLASVDMSANPHSNEPEPPVSYHLPKFQSQQEILRHKAQKEIRKAAYETQYAHVLPRNAKPQQSRNVDGLVIRNSLNRSGEESQDLNESQDSNVMVVSPDLINLINADRAYQLKEMQPLVSSSPRRSMHQLPRLSKEPRIQQVLSKQKVSKGNVVWSHIDELYEGPSLDPETTETVAVNQGVSQPQSSLHSNQGKIDVHVTASPGMTQPTPGEASPIRVLSKYGSPRDVAVNVNTREVQASSVEDGSKMAASQDNTFRLQELSNSPMPRLKNNQFVRQVTDPKTNKMAVTTNFRRTRGAGYVKKETTHDGKLSLGGSMAGGDITTLMAGTMGGSDQKTQMKMYTTKGDGTALRINEAEPLDQQI